MTRSVAGWLRRLPRWTVVGGIAGGVVACAVLATVGIKVATADDTAGKPVPADVLVAIKTAAPSCPTLSAPRLAGQAMATSRFDPHATTDFGGTGIAGLTAVAWSRWAPTSSASRDDAAANIVALAHDMCDLVGELRVDNVAGDEWRNALGAYHSGLDAVTGAGGVPTDAASYVDKVASYTAWYALRPEFGGPGTASPAPPSSVPPSATASVAATTATASRPAVPSSPTGTPRPTSPASGPAPTTTRPVPPTTIAPPPPPPAGHPVVGEESSRCLDVAGGSHASGAPVDIWDCAGVDNQKWALTQAGELRVYSGAMCLDAPSTNSMTRVVVRPCDGSAGQRWSVHNDRTITSVPSGECLDVMGYVVDNGTPLQIWPCNGASNERWNLD